VAAATPAYAGTADSGESEDDLALLSVDELVARLIPTHRPS
jgi:hypothetical protein